MKHMVLPRVIHLEHSPAQINSSRSRRTILLINPKSSCRYAIEKGACKFCGFWKSRPQNEGVLFEDAIKEIDGGRVEFLIGGSMLDQIQVPQTQLERMLRLLATTNADSVLLETRPEYVTEENVLWLQEILGDKTLEIAIGLETTNDSLRTELNKGYSRSDVQDAFLRVVRSGGLPVAYLLIGLNVGEVEATNDFRSSVKDLRSMQDELGVPIRIALEPFFSTQKQHKVGSYLSPVYVAQRVHEAVAGFGMSVFIATSSEGLASHPLDSVRPQIDEFNATQNVEHLSEIIARGNKGAN